MERNMMPKSKNNRKGKSRIDKRPVKRSGVLQTASSADPSVRGQQAADMRQSLGSMRQCKYLDRICLLPQVFSKDKCAEIINTCVNTWEERESMIQKDDPSSGEIKQNFAQDLDYRNTTLFIPPKPDKEIFETILGNIMQFNNSDGGYGFDIHGMAEPPNMMRYMAPDINPNGKAGKYDWHMDLGPGPVPSMRKLSYSILLNAGEYEGGELAFHVGRNTDPFPGQTGDEAVGNMILFPSYLVHSVLPVTKGTRYAIVGWVHGNSFR
jgi:hypothetical protein